MGKSRETYPKIALITGEQQREELLKRLGRSFQDLMDARNNPCALKGGTAMRLGMGLPRPSEDLDFEGDQRIAVRKTIVDAVNAAFPEEECRVGWDWFRRGTVQITVGDEASRNRTRITIDYRVAGSMPSMPARVDIERCTRLHGMNVYKGVHLTERKLNTMIGERPRRKNRDVYDTGWLVHERPEFISSYSAARLKDWIRSLSKRDKTALKEDMQIDRVIGRCYVEDAWRLLEQGIAELKVETDG